MNEREKEIEEQLRKMAEEVPVPESLEPGQLEERLKKEEKTVRGRGFWKKYAAAAACVVLVCGGLLWTFRESLFYTVIDRGELTTSHSSMTTGHVTGGAEMEAAESYEQIYGYLEAYFEEQKTSSGKASADTEMIALDGDAAQESVSTKSGDIASSYSETNLRQEGVDEGDIVKTDGRYLYTRKDNETEIAIVDTSQGQLKEAAVIKTENLNVIYEFYVVGQKLIVVGERERDVASASDSSWYATESSTVAVTYDVSDAANPALLGEVSQSGIFTSSRVEGGYLYLFSQHAMYSDDGIAPADTERFIPLVNDTVMSSTDVYLPQTKTACMYELVTSVAMEAPNQVKASKAIFTNGGQLYVSQNNIYWYESGAGNFGDSITTSIRKLTYKDGVITGQASGTVPGYIHDSFCIDEYQGYLRVILTSGSSNSVYVLDDKLEEVGSIKNLAKDERVYSARLLGDVGYFVTFRETDPLFSVDFSDPANPKVLGELKIPGFSEYLHFYGEDKLLGIGMDADEDGMTSGVKLSMFDISDNTNVLEENTLPLENIYNADVLYDYKAALIDVDRNFIGFSAYDGSGEKYYVFTYDETGFHCLMDEEVNGGGYSAARGVYIDNTLYVVKGNIIEAYEMDEYQKIGDVIL